MIDEYGAVVDGYGNRLATIKLETLKEILAEMEEASEQDDGQRVYELIEELRRHIPELSEE